MNDNSGNFGQPDGEQKCAQVDRRGFISGSIAAGTVGVLSAGTFADRCLAGPAARPFGSLHDLTCQDFQRLVGQSFEVGSLPAENCHSSTMVLTNVVVQNPAKDRHRPKNVRPEGFALQFRSRGSQHLGEGTYLFSGDKMAATPIFVQPLGEQRGGYDSKYIAIFN